MRKLVYIFILGTALVACKTQQSATNTKKLKKEFSTSFNEAYFSKLFIDACNQKVLGNYQQAVNLFKQCIQENEAESAPYYEIGRILFQSGQYADASGYAMEAVERNPSNFWYGMLYGQSLVKSGKVKDAIAVYEKLIITHPQHEDLYYDLANLYKASRDWNGMIKSLDRLEERIGVTEEISIEKQRAYVRLNDVDKAAAEINKLIEAFPKNTRYLSVLADLYSTNNRDKEAMEVFERILKQDPNDPFVHLSLADYYKAKGENDKSYDHLTKAFRNEHLEVDAKMQILLSYYQITEVFPELKGQAIELADVLVEVHPESAKGHTIRGDFLLRDNKKKEACAAFQKAVALDKSRFPIWSQLILLESELNYRDSLKVHSGQAMELFPNQPLPYLMNGMACLDLKDYETGLKSLKAGSGLVVDNQALESEFNRALGETYHALEKHVESDYHFDQCLKLDPDNELVLNNYAYFLSLRGEKLDKAESMSARSLKLRPNQSTYLDTYGWIKFQQGEYEKALEYLQKAADLGGDKSGEVMEHIGDTYFKLGQKDKALEYWNKARSLGGSSKSLAEKIARKGLVE